MAAPTTHSPAALRGRCNLVDRKSESWQPPAFSTTTTWRGRMTGWVRRLLDLQAKTIWRDLSAILPQARGRLIDVGCGAQPYRPLLPPHVQYMGIDTADAKSRFGYQIPDTTYYAGDRWPVADQSSDWILCTETLEHVLDPRRMLAEAARCLRPGGRIVITVPFAARWHYIPYDYWRYTPSSLKLLLEEAGFVEVAVYARGNSVTVACYKAMALILQLLMPQQRSWPLRIPLQIAGLLLSPALAAMALSAELSLLGSGGDDCLGYTVLARKAG